MSDNLVLQQDTISSPRYLKFSASTFGVKDLGQGHSFFFGRGVGGLTKSAIQGYHNSNIKQSEFH